jgi:hypothetical protein
MAVHLGLSGVSCERAVCLAHRELIAAGVNSPEQAVGAGIDNATMVLTPSSATAVE